VVQDVLTPERLVMEHIMLVAILHANVGTEVSICHFIKIYFLVFICIGFAHLGRDPLIRKLNETLLSTRPDPQLFKNVFM
jgi:hypothetical protein